MMLRQELQVKLKLNLNLLLKNQVEVLLYSVQELEELLRREREINPFIEEVVVSQTHSRFFEDRKTPEPVRDPHPLEKLTQNIRLELEGTDVDIALELVSHTDEKGFFVGDTEEIAKKFGVSVEYVEDIRKLVMTLEPSGVCSKNLREFLRLQIEEMYPGEDYLFVELEKVLKGQKPSEEAKEKLRRLRTSPLGEVAPVVRVCKVDAIIELDDGELVPHVYEELIDIKPNPSYIAALSRTGGKAREFLREYMERYENLKRILSLRRENLKKILEEVVRVQAPFLKGEGSLRTLLAKDVAYKLGISESTVSRLINSKYVKTPQGTYPLRFFFVRASASGISQEELMRKLKEIVSSESPEKPLSDEEIAKRLREEGYRVARRTVAKYRELLGIPSSRARRRV